MNKIESIHRKEAKQMNWKKWTGIVIVLAILIFIGYSVWNSSQTEQLPTARTATVSEDTVTEVVASNGTIVPSETQEISGQGIVSELNVSVGDSVNEGDSIVTYIDGTEYTANFNGTITEVNITEDEPDTNAQQGQSSITLSNLNNLEVEVNLSRSDATEVKVDQPVKLTYNDKEYDGTISTIDPVATQQQTQTGSSSSLGAVITFNSKPEGLIAGFEIDADITVASADQTLVIPIEALNYDEDNLPYVFTIDDRGIANKVDIETGIQSNTNIEIISGLDKGDQVILSPSDEISNDTQVEVED